MPLNTRPVIERIAEALLYRLRLLTAGYSVFTPVREVIRPTRLGGYTPRHLQIVVTQLAPERMPEYDLPGDPPALAWMVQFNIRCHVLPSEKDTTEVDEITNTMAADVVKVVCDETAELPEFVGFAWHTFRNLTIWAEWQSMEAIDSDGSFDGINIPLAVTYRTDETNPYIARA